MKQIFLMLALAAGAMTAYGQHADSVSLPAEQIEVQIPLKARPSFGDYFAGYSRAITYDRMIPPYGLEVTFDKTVHIIFPASIVYVDLGSADIIAARADGAENVVRVKAAVRGFGSETNLAVITSDGSFYTYNVRYADEPRKLSVEMKDFMHDGEAVNRPNNALEVYLRELANESDNAILSRDEMMLLMSTPRIPEIIYRYSRYHFEATLEYLKQCDVKYDLKVMDNDEMVETIHTFQTEIPKEDTSSFSFDKRGKDAKENAESNSIRLDVLCDRFEELESKGLNDKSEEGQELRGMIRAFIEQEKLTVRVTRSTTNSDLLDMIEDSIHGTDGKEDDPKPDPEPEPEPEGDPDPEEEEKPARRRR